jgi:hypothetical protein
MRWALFAIALAGGFAVFEYVSVRTDADRRADVVPPGAATADDIVSLYATNVVAAEERYRHLTMPVVGTVDRVSKDDVGAVWVRFRTSHGDLPATFKNIDGLAALTPGARAIVTCETTHRLRDGQPVLVGCELAP